MSRDQSFVECCQKGWAERDEKLSPLSLKLADQIKALPTKCIREAIAEIIDPYLKEENERRTIFAGANRLP